METRGRGGAERPFRGDGDGRGSGFRPLRFLRRAALWLLALAVIAAVVAVATAWRTTALTFRQLLTENKQLREAIANLTHEDQIGYAKVLRQETRDGRLRTTLRFVETDRNDKTRPVLQVEYEVEGDVVYFDALIVKFSDRLVQDGRERALYLWRRIYGEKMRPEDGHPIEAPGQEPRRYADLFAKLPLKHRTLFWSEIWDLADDPDRLRDLGITAIYGNAVYRKVRPGLIYVFKISNTGAMYPETVPDL